MKGIFINYFWYTISITLNALGNSFMIIANIGSAPWTSAGENLVYILPFSIGTCVIMLQLLSFLLSHMMKVKLNIKMVIQSMLLTIAFGILIDLFLYLHFLLHIPNDLAIRYIYLFLGLNFIAIAISIYFQTSTVYLPTDYLLRAFGKLMKNYTLGTITWTAIPLSISISIIIYRKQAVGIGLGTLIFIFFFGFLIDFYNRRIVIYKTGETSGGDSRLQKSSG